jgi:hypothetical protein
LPFVQFLGSNMAGWVSTSQAQLEELVLHLDGLEHQVLDTVITDLAADQLTSTLDMGQSPTL